MTSTTAQGSPEKSRRRVKVRERTRKIVSEYFTAITACRTDEAAARSHLLKEIRSMQDLKVPLRAAELSYASEDDPHPYHWGTSASQSYIEEANDGQRTRRRSKSQETVDVVNDEVAAAQLDHESRRAVHDELRQAAVDIVRRHADEQRGAQSVEGQPDGRAAPQ
jgi:hypothetical protein